MEQFELGSAPKLEGATLVVATVAQGNVGELAMDLLISNLDAHLITRLENPNVMACVGNDAHDMSNPGTLSTSLELFEVNQATGLAEEGGRPGIFLLQQRAPAIQGRQAEWAEDLTEWAQSRGFAQMVVLCGLDATLRKDKQIVGSAARYLAGQSTEMAAAAEALGVQQLEEEYLAEERKAHGLLPPWPVLAASSRRGLPHLMLGCFSAEGDNVPHSMEVATLMLALLAKLSLLNGPKEGAPLRMPCSFAALYGRTTGFDAFLG